MIHKYHFQKTQNPIKILCHEDWLTEAIGTNAGLLDFMIIWIKDRGTDMGAIISTGG